ncbi:transporter associated domain-containing protein [Celeribacter indicus]|uniref:Hemolysin n=1 Tax=Celeribacter indicus TaxID=1208324 RepID=A0A0B5E0P6_9RHOB|nr:hemolysin family protein [Celeribacter indicus]AJE46037.1 hemolysin [Celeribacter indicus]SDX33380.1 magnesium and cobalt transporter [Celeribacter indicus]
MGDTEPGSSTAAQSAPIDPMSMTQTATGTRPASRKGRNWFDRVAQAFSTKPGQQGAVTEAPATVPAPSARPGMMNLRRMRVDDVAIPKAEIVAVPSDIRKDDLVRVFRESGMTRLPVYKGTLDTPVGLVHLKDFALNYGFNGTGERFNLKKMLRPLIYAPPSMPIGVLLQKMQSDRMHMALVIDEYGGVDGLVTLEDLVEQVIGEIEDEHDIDEGAFWTQTAPGVYIAQAKAPLEEFEAAVGMKFTDEEDEEEIDTLGGLVVVLCGRVPARGEVIPHPSGSEFEIVDADPRRIKRVRVRLPSAVKKKNEA